MNTVSQQKTIEVEGPELASTIKQHEQAGWRCTSIEVTGPASYSLHLCRLVEVQKELLP